MCYSKIKLTAWFQSLLRSLWLFIYSRSLPRFTEPKCWLLGGRRHMRQLKPSRIISLYLSKIQVDVIVLPMSDLREEQSVVNTVFTNIFFLFRLTKCHVEWIPRVFLIRKVLLSNLDLKACSLAWRFCFLVSLQACAAIVPQIKPRSLPYASFPSLLARPAVWRCCNLGESFAKKKNSFNSQSVFGYNWLVLVAFTLLNYIIVWSDNCVRP